ncbi:adenosylcobinamide-GDP ribazoletransferase [Pseudodesulfovibrio sp. F-1]|uniref:Adenosylcobinamide-GDP ribazoletransferase n=1 Tax=Pseudodesulfovibrio alkaliphilus TaxID=2661613 RepID=A0A7K1KPA1_9BACT|nr:adenosylcobinamide-GDP ribazoletransferase [Pseudodesulfovibrio alkaliphilus]MUM77800.1 adenosylcobinamide-GDP ribazoletransferase [Pseudodesulfovibrio alkaliphilus]
MGVPRTFFSTLGFLTRLGPSRVMTDQEMGRCMAHLPLVGAVLGAVAVLPFALGLLSHSPWIQAWLVVGLSLFLTRGLHFDGLADVCDAVTTHADPDRFWTVIKDSRAGAFGVMGLVMALGGQVILFREMFAAGAFGTAAWAFILGRASAVCLGGSVRRLTRPGLGKLFIDGATPKTALAATVLTIGAGVFLAGPMVAVGAATIAGLTLIPLFKLARHVKGANGDFLGCAVILGELSAGLGFALLG